ncbi:MAG: decaprenyl-phosphate phosphoribosyltransferase [Bacteroidota bacterium]
MGIKSFIKNILVLSRPHQYVKNLAVFLPLFFAIEILNGRLFLNAIIAFVAFSMCASGVYILNDYFDIENDRLHPKKQFRPLAAGTISKPAAFTVMGIFFVLGETLMASLSPKAAQILGVYILMNVAYSYYLKHVTILDVTIIATGFVLRLFVGSEATSIPLSKWIVLMTFLMALFMALGKRRDDVLVFMNTGKKMRRVIDGYNLRFLDGAMMIMSSVVIVAYILYTTSAEVIQKLRSDYVYLTTIFVVLGILRYLQIAFVEEDSGEPTNIALKDRFMHLTILAWIVAFIWILYL